MKRVCHVYFTGEMSEEHMIGFADGRAYGYERELTNTGIAELR